MTSKQYIYLLDENRNEFLDRALENPIVVQKLKEANITDLRSNAKHFIKETPTNKNRKSLFGVGGEWIGMVSGPGVCAKWTIFCDILLILAMTYTKGFEKLKAKDGNQREAIMKAGSKYRSLFKYYTGYDTGRTDSSLQNAGLTYAVIAKEKRQCVNVLEQSNLLQEAESKISDIQDKLQEISSKKYELEKQKSELEREKENELEKMSKMLQSLNERFNNMEHETDKRVREAEELAKYHEKEKNKAIKLNDAAAKHTAIRVICEQEMCKEFMTMEGGEDHLKKIMSNISDMTGNSNAIMFNTALPITNTTDNPTV